VLVTAPCPMEASTNDVAPRIPTFSTCYIRPTLKLELPGIADISGIVVK